MTYQSNELSNHLREGHQTIRLSLPPFDLTLGPTSFRTYGWSLLTSIISKTIAVRNRFEALQADFEESSPKRTCSNFADSHEKAAAEVIPLKPKHQQHIPWESNNIES